MSSDSDGSERVPDRDDERDKATVRASRQTSAKNGPPPQKRDSVGTLLSVPYPRSFIEKIPFVGFAFDLYRSYSRRNGPLLSAGIAYYALFSMGPLMLLTLQLTGWLFNSRTQGWVDELTHTLEEYLGEDLAALLANLSGQMSGVSTATNYTFAIVGLGILLYGSTRLFVRLQASFNIMWDVRIVVRTFSMRRALSRLAVFGMILIPTLLLVVAVILTTAFSWLSNLIGGGVLTQIAQILIPFVMSWLALLVIFAVLPDIRLSWRDCWFTTFLVAIAWLVATRIFGIYISWSGSSKYVGAIGAVVGIIFWTDIMAIITLIGVRFNKALYLWRGKVIQPYDYAAPVTELPKPDVDTPPDAEVVAGAAADEPPPTASEAPAAETEQGRKPESIASDPKDRPDKD